jgi:hypothetical protein
VIDVAEARHAQTLRRGFTMLAGAAIVGTAVELAIERHWDSAVQYIPWVALAVLGAVLMAVIARPSPPVVRGTRVAAVLVGLSSLIGMWEHVDGNFHAGYLDRRYERTWTTMSSTSRWWAAVTRGVGPAPPLAPAILALAAVCVWFATVGVRTREAPGSRIPGPLPTGSDR